MRKWDLLRRSAIVEGTASPTNRLRGQTVEISGIFSALFIGLIIGALGRLVIPGKQDLKIWVTLLIGVVAALLGTLVASVLGVANTRGIDWIELALQVGFAAAGVAVISGASSRKKS